MRSRSAPARENSRAHQLDGHALLVFVVGTFGEIDIAHSAGTELATIRRAQALTFEELGIVATPWLSADRLHPRSRL